MAQREGTLPAPGLAAGVIDRLIEAAGRRFFQWCPEGRLTVRFPSGRERTIGRPDAWPAAAFSINRYRVLWRSIMRATNGFADSYMDGDVDIDDLVQLFTFFLRNEKKLNESAGNMIDIGRSDRRFHAHHRNTEEGSRENIHAHYDLGNAFYAQWLDETMTYSSAYFDGGAKTLKEAQEAKYRNICEALAVRPGEHIFEIGCGWGGFAEFAALNYGARVTGITISEEQLKFARERLASAGLAERTDIRFLDYRKSEGAFDHVVSIEMIEAVGEEFWPVYFRTVAERLKPGGRAAIQAITIDEDYFDGYRSNVDFIQRYIFPGGMLLTDSAIRENSALAGMSADCVLAFGKSYAETLRRWRRRFLDAWESIEPLGFDERFSRMWQYYLAYCETGFDEKRIDLGLYRLEKPA